MARKYKDKDITFIYKTGDLNQINRLKKYARTIKWNGENIKCKKAFFNYATDIIDFVDADEYIQILHTDYKEQIKNIGYGFVKTPKITKYIGVSKIVCEHFKELTGLDCELCYNPIELDTPKKILKLISATRLSNEKGRNRMIRLGQLLNEANIPYQWTIFTNDISKIKNDNMIFMKPRLDISNYIADADYLVQLSDNGEGFGYTPIEALILGTPVIVTPCDAFLEVGIKDGENGFILDFNMNNVDVNKIYNSKLNFKYNPPKTNWEDILVDGKSNYEEEKEMRFLVEATDEYEKKGINDIQRGEVKKGDQWEVDFERKEVLTGKNNFGVAFVKVIKEINDEKVNEKNEDKAEKQEDNKKVVKKTRSK